MNSIATKWFLRLQSILEEQSKLAGLLGHGTMIGNAREFFAQRMLKTFLPPAVHIGSGKVVSFSSDVESKQIDIVLHDPNFPFLEIAEGFGTYPVEGVIATIEVKSRCTRQTLLESLTNCESVLQIPMGLNDRFQKRIDELVAEGYSEVKAKIMVTAETKPWTYVFAFESDLNCGGVADTVRQWLDSRPYDQAKIYRLPRLIVLGNIVGAQNAPPSDITAFDNNLLSAETVSAAPAMGIRQIEVSLGLFACHILGAVGSRKLGKPFRAGVDLGPSLGSLAEIFFGGPVANMTMIFPPRGTP